MQTGALSRVAFRRRRGRLPLGQEGSGGRWTLIGGLGLAMLVGTLAGGGTWWLALVVVAVPVFVVATVAQPWRMALGLIMVLPFLFAPATVGGFSIFLALPLFGFTAIVLVTRERATLARLRRDLPVAAFMALFAIATFSAVLSADPTRGASRLVYLALFGLFAWGVAAAISSGRLTREAVAKAVVVGGTVAAIAVSIQFLAQFAVGQGTVRDWLFDVEALFAGERAATGPDVSNWRVPDLDLLRGIFPFMSPPSAGQYLMLSFLAAVWLARERHLTAKVPPLPEILAAAVIGAGLLATISRQAWVGAIVGIAALALARRRPSSVLPIAIPLALVVTLVPIPGAGGSFADFFLSASDTSTVSSRARIDLWTTALGLVPEQGLLGVGPGQIGSLVTLEGGVAFYAHNVFLDAAVELGVGGALALIAVFALAMAAAVRRRASLAFAMLAAYVVANLFDDVLYFPRNGLLLAVAFALIAGGPGARRKLPPASGSAMRRGIDQGRPRGENEGEPDRAGSGIIPEGSTR